MFRRKWASAVCPYVCVCVTEREKRGLAVVDLAYVCSGHGPRLQHVYELPFCAELIILTKVSTFTWLHTHTLDKSLYENPLILYD